MSMVTLKLHHILFSSIHISDASLQSLCLATIADHAGQRVCISLGIQAQLLQVKTHGNQHLEQSGLLLGGLVHQGWAGGVALRPLAGVHQVERAAFGRASVVACCLQTPVPAVQGTGQRGAFDLKTHPFTAGHKLWKKLTENVSNGFFRRKSFIKEMKAKSWREKDYLLVMTVWERQDGAKTALEKADMRTKSIFGWWRCVNRMEFEADNSAENSRDTSEGVFELQTQVLNVLPLLIREALCTHVDVFHPQLLLIKQPLHHEQRRCRKKQRIRIQKTSSPGSDEGTCSAVTLFWTWKKENLFNNENEMED